MPPSFDQPMAGKTGKNCLDYAGMVLVPSGSRAQAACVYIPLSLIPAILGECGSPFQLRGHFAPTMAGTPGHPSIADCARSIFLIPPPKWATACITLP